MWIFADEMPYIRDSDKLDAIVHISNCTICHHRDQPVFYLTAARDRCYSQHFQVKSGLFFRVRQQSGQFFFQIILENFQQCSKLMCGIQRNFVDVEIRFGHKFMHPPTETVFGFHHRFEITFTGRQCGRKVNFYLNFIVDDN